jgi:hypothetical protein
MGKLNLAQIKAAQVGSATSNQDRGSAPPIVDSQVSISQDSYAQVSKKSKKPEVRSDGSEVRRSKDAQIIIRASPRMRRELKRWAVDEDATVQSLIVAGLQALRRERGLPSLAE